MRKCVGFATLAVIFALSAAQASAQAWALRDAGVGLVIQDGDYASQLKIAQRGDTWDLEELYAGGAFGNRYRGNQGFAAWLVGPHSDTYLNKNGLPVWSYKYKVTYPDGKTYEGGPAGFYTPGFACVGLSSGSGGNGKWKIEWWIVNRDTQEVRHVATKEIAVTWGKPAQAAADGGWTLKDMGVGLVIQDGDYASQLKIAQRGDTWDLKELYAGGAFGNRYRGNQGFAAWLVGPHSDTYLNKNGLPIWSYKYKVTYPDGKTYESGPSGFYTPGFACVGLSSGSGGNGKWKIEWWIVNRDTQEVRHVGTSEITVTW